MKTYNWRLILGLCLLAFGILALLQSLNVIQTSGSLWALVPASLFLIGGWAFLNILTVDRRQWWAVIPGVTLAAIGLLIVIDTLLPSVGKVIGGFIVLGGIAAAFWLVYIMERRNWWAIIPAGTLTTLGIISVIPTNVGSLGGLALGGLFFMGLAATFMLVAILPPHQEPREWAYFPAGGLMLMAILLMFFEGGAVNFVWPVVLILLGIFMLARTFGKRKV